MRKSCFLLLLLYVELFTEELETTKSEIIVKRREGAGGS